MNESIHNNPSPSERTPRVIEAENTIFAFIQSSDTKPGTVRGVAVLDCIDEREREAEYLQALEEVETEPLNLERQEQLQLARLRYALILERRTSREAQFPGYFNHFDQFDLLCMHLAQAHTNRGNALTFLNEQREVIARTE